VAPGAGPRFLRVFSCPSPWARRRAIAGPMRLTSPTAGSDPAAGPHSASGCRVRGWAAARRQGAAFPTWNDPPVSPSASRLILASGSWAVHVVAWTQPAWTRIVDGPWTRPRISPSDPRNSWISPLAAGSDVVYSRSCLKGPWIRTEPGRLCLHEWTGNGRDRSSFGRFDSRRKSLRVERSCDPGSSVPTIGVSPQAVAGPDTASNRRVVRPRGLGRGRDPGLGCRPCRSRSTVSRTRAALRAQTGRIIVWQRLGIARVPNVRGADVTSGRATRRRGRSRSPTHGSSLAARCGGPGKGRFGRFQRLTPPRLTSGVKRRLRGR
jgi:hypothetical protein